MPTMSTSHHIQQANLEHAEALMHLVNVAYRPQHPHAQAWTHESDWVLGQRINITQMRDALNQKNAVILMLTDNKVILACVQVEQLGDVAYIGMLSVLPECQNMGLGKIMLDAAEQFAQSEWHIKQFKMSVITARESLMAYYLRRGYVQTGEFFDYPTDANVGLPKAELQLEYLIKTTDIGFYKPKIE